MSSQKSTNYGLHVWEAQDKFSRKEINENTEKTDAAIKANADRIEAVHGEMRWVKLLDRTLAADTENWVLDVSGIDFFRYAEIRVLTDGETDTVLALRPNGVMKQDYTFAATNNNPSKTGSLGELGYATEYTRHIRLGPPRRGWRIAAWVDRVQRDGSILVAVYTAPVKWEELQSFHITRMYDNTVVPAGMRVILVGLRK